MCIYSGNQLYCSTFCLTEMSDNSKCSIVIWRNEYNMFPHSLLKIYTMTILYIDTLLGLEKSYVSMIIFIKKSTFWTVVAMLQLFNKGDFRISLFSNYLSKPLWVFCCFFSNQSKDPKTSNQFNIILKSWKFLNI